MPSKPFSLAVKAVIFDDQQRCLLIRRSAANRSFVGCWEWPGGKVDPGEDFATAVVRESREETGLEVEITALAGANEFEMPHVHVVLLCMEAKKLSGEIRLSDEHDEFAWVSLKDLAGHNLPPQHQALMLEYARNKMDAASRAGQLAATKQFPS